MGVWQVPVCINSVGNGFPETNGVAINALLDEVTYLLPTFLGTVEKGLGHIFWKNYSGGNIKKCIWIVSRRIRHQAWRKASHHLLEVFLVTFHSPRSCFLVRCCLPPWSPYIVFKAEVMDACSWIVKSHRLRAGKLCNMPITPPLDLELALIDCSRAISAETVKRAELNDLWNDSQHQARCIHLGVLVPVAACRWDKRVRSEHSSACP